MFESIPICSFCGGVKSIPLKYSPTIQSSSSAGVKICHCLPMDVLKERDVKLGALENRMIYYITKYVPIEDDTEDQSKTIDDAIGQALLDLADEAKCNVQLVRVTPIVMQHATYITVIAEPYEAEEASLDTMIQPQWINGFNALLPEKNEMLDEQ